MQEALPGGEKRIRNLNMVLIQNVGIRVKRNPATHSRDDKEEGEEVKKEEHASNLQNLKPNKTF